MERATSVGLRKPVTALGHQNPPLWLLAYEVHTRASNGELLVETRALNEGWPAPEKVAELVLQQRSGWAFWDSLPPICFPASLDDWQQVDPYDEVEIKS